MSEYKDRRGNLWSVDMLPPDPLPIHKGIVTDHWRVLIQFPDGSAVEHGHQNLAEAIAEAVAKTGWVKYE